MTDLEKEREAFEEMAHKMGMCLDQYWGDGYDNPYENDDTSLAYNIFREGAKSKQAEITELKQKLEKLESGEWINVKDRRPQLSDCILQGEAFLAWDGQEIRRIPFRMYRENSDITDWMPMPKPPKPTNLIDSFIADGGFDRVMGCKNGE